MKTTPPRYSMVIEWFDTDHAYLVTLPEWASHARQPVTHGDTYEETVKNGHEVLEMLIEGTQQAPVLTPKTDNDRQTLFFGDGMRCINTRYLHPSTPCKRDHCSQFRASMLQQSTY